MKVLRPVFRGLGCLFVLASIVAPVATSLRRPSISEAGVCVNPGCQCGAHEPGVKCCCAPEQAEGFRQGLYQAGCGGRQETLPPIPTSDRVAILPAAQIEMALPSRRISGPQRPLVPPRRPPDPLDHVPRAEA